MSKTPVREEDKFIEIFKVILVETGIIDKSSAEITARKLLRKYKTSGLKIENQIIKSIDYLPKQSYLTTVILFINQLTSLNIKLLNTKKINSILQKVNQLYSINSKNFVCDNNGCNSYILLFNQMLNNNNVITIDLFNKLKTLINGDVRIINEKG